MQGVAGRGRVGQAVVGVAVVLLLAGCGVTDATGGSAPAVSSSAVVVTVQASPEETVRAAVADALGDLNRDGARLDQVTYWPDDGGVTVTYALNDNLSSGMIRTGAWGDNADIIRALRATGLKLGPLVTTGTFEMLDDLGNPLGERPVFTVEYSAKAVNQANLDNLPGDMLESAADNVTIHPALRD